MPTLRPITPLDRAFVLELNERFVHLLSPLDEPRLTRLLDWADRAEVLEVDGEPAGFVICVGPGTAYDSANYRWFADRFEDAFYYLDRVVLDDRFQRRGLGNLAYDAMEDTATAYGRMVLEVDVAPPNEASMAFHAARGYAEIARHTYGEPAKQVAMLARELG